MRKNEFLKQQSAAAATKARLEGREKLGHERAAPDGGEMAGTCLVQTALAFGRGSVCDVEVTVGGRATGVRYHEAACYDALLSVGDHVQFLRRADGTVELISGGGGVTSTSTTLDGSLAVFVGMMVSGS